MGEVVGKKVKGKKGKKVKGKKGKKVKGKSLIDHAYSHGICGVCTVCGELRADHQSHKNKG